MFLVPLEVPDSPHIVPRSAHTLSRKFITVEALKVLYRLHHNGYKAYLVGGSVRDLLLGKTPKDFDVATDARPSEIRKLFRNSRIIGRRFRLVQVFFRGGKIVEVSTFRCRSEFEDSGEVPLARNNTYGTPAEDAHRRDLTINGLFYNIADFSLVDYVGGLADLHRGCIRVIGEPAVRFQRDPVRMFRVLRHAARTGFGIDPATWEEIRAKGVLIRLCPPSRLRDEVLKDLRSGAARPFFDLLLKSALFYAFLPTWKDRLGKSGEERLLEMAGRLDAVCQPEVPVSENILWAMVLTPYVERGNLPEEMKQLRVVIHEQIQAALAGLEFPRQRQEEVTQIMALNRLLTPLLQEDRHIPVRLSRLTTFPEAMLLYQLQHKPVELLAGLSLELPAPAVSPAPRRQGRPRRRPRRNRRRRPDRSVISDQ